MVRLLLKTFFILLFIQPQLLFSFEKSFFLPDDYACWMDDITQSLKQTNHKILIVSTELNSYPLERLLTSLLHQHVTIELYTTPPHIHTLSRWAIYQGVELHSINRAFSQLSFSLIGIDESTLYIISGDLDDKKMRNDLTWIEKRFFSPEKFQNKLTHLLQTD